MASAIPTIEPRASLDPAPPGTEIVSMRTANSQTFQQADGSYITEFSTEPRFYQPEGSKDWRPISVGFAAPADDGSLVSSRAPATVELRDGGDADGFLVVHGGDRQISIGLPSGQAAEARGLRPERVMADGHAARYDGLLTTGEDLMVAPRADGVQTFLVLDQRPADNAFTFIIRAPGLDLRVRDDGTIAIRNAAGRAIGSIRAPYAVDSSDVPLLGSGESTSDVTTDLVAKGDDRWALILTVDPAFLAKATYPVYLDPLIIFPQDAGGVNDTFVYEGSPTTNYHAYARPDSPYYNEMWLGEKPGSGGKVARAFVKFWGIEGQIAGAHVDEAIMRIYPYYQATSPKNTWIKRVSQDWDELAVNWNNQPNVTTLTSPDPTTYSSSQGTTMQIDVTATVQGWVSGTFQNYGFRLDENGNGTDYWKRLIAKEQASDDSPRLRVWWYRPVATIVSPTSDAWTSSRTLSWTYDDNNGNANYPQSHFEVQVAIDPDFEFLVPGSGETASASTSWTIPTGLLESDTEYYWRVRAKDGHGWSEWATSSFHYMEHPPTPAQFDTARSKGAELLGISVGNAVVVQVQEERSTAGTSSFITFLVGNTIDERQAWAFVDESSAAALSEAQFVDLAESTDADPMTKFSDLAMDEYDAGGEQEYAILVGGVDIEGARASVRNLHPSVEFDSEFHFDVSDEAVFDAVQADYIAAQIDAVGTAVTPVISELSPLAPDAEAMEITPLVYATLTPAEAVTMAEDPNVLRLLGTSDDWSHGTTRTAGRDIDLDDAQATAGGLDGAGIRIGIVEYGRTDSNPALANARAGYRRVVVVTDEQGKQKLRCDDSQRAAYFDPHATRVASIAVGRTVDTWGPGAAPAARYLEIGADINGAEGQVPDKHMVKAVECAVLAGADIVNMSFAQNEPAKTGSAIESMVDYLADTNDVLFVGIAGNRGNVGGPQCLAGSNKVPPPGSAFNVLAVGGMVDKDGHDGNPWSLTKDDLWRAGEAYGDQSALPSYCWEDPKGRTKPEVLAPAAEIDTPDLPTRVNNTPQAAGTSLAAPLVAGVAALVIDAFPSLRRQDVETIRAILMASTADMPRLQRNFKTKDYEGLGTINAKDAVDIARRASGIGGHSFAEAVPATCGSMARPVSVTSGDKVRVVVTWNAHPKTKQSPSRLANQLTLKVKGPGGIDKTATQVSGNVRWVDFKAPSSGTYYFYIQRPKGCAIDAGNPSEEVGWAWFIH